MRIYVSNLRLSLRQQKISRLNALTLEKFRSTSSGLNVNANRSKRNMLIWRKVQRNNQSIQVELKKKKKKTARDIANFFSNFQI